jgi:hypothetical protein
VYAPSLALQEEHRPVESESERVRIERDQFVAQPRVGHHRLRPVVVSVSLSTGRTNRIEHGNGLKIIHLPDSLENGAPYFKGLLRRCRLRVGSELCERLNAGWQGAI